MEAASALALFGSLSLFAWWFVGGKNDAEDRMRALSSNRAPATRQDPFTRRVLAPAAQALLSRITERLPAIFLDRARRWLIVSDSEVKLSTFVVIVLAMTVTLPLVLLVMLGATGALNGRVLLMLPLAAAAGFAFPMMTLRRRALDRQARIIRALPETLDLLTVCVEAGLSLDYAFQRVAERQQGPMRDEINRMLQEKALGETRKEALTGLAERIDLPDVNIFTQSVIQAETQGTSISGVLRTQARQLRVRRRQQAEQAAQKAGPKMVFPLVFFVLPSLFIVVIGPVAINTWEGFGGF